MKPKPTTLLLALCAIALTGCVEQTQEQKQKLKDEKIERLGNHLNTVEYNGHSYIIYSEFQTGSGITHDPDCPCHNKQSKQ